MYNPNQNNYAYPAMVPQNNGGYYPQAAPAYYQPQMMSAQQPMPQMMSAQQPMPQMMAPQQPMPQMMAPQQPMSQMMSYSAPAPAPVEEYNQALTYKFAPTVGEDRAIIVKNVEAPHAVDLCSSTLKFNRFTPKSNGTITFNFKPDGRQHDVSLMNYDKPVAKFTLKPKPTEVEFLENGSKKMKIHNLYEPSSFKLLSDKPEAITHRLEPIQDKPHSYYLHFDAKDQVHSINLCSAGADGKSEPMINGSFTLAPLNKPAAPAFQPAPQQPMMYAYPAPYMMQQPMYSQPQMYSQPPMYSQPMYPPPPAYAPQYQPMPQQQPVMQSRSRIEK